MLPIFIKNDLDDVVVIFGTEYNNNKQSRLCFSMDTGWFVVDVKKTYSWKVAEPSKARQILEDELNRQGYQTKLAKLLVQEEVDNMSALPMLGEISVLAVDTGLFEAKLHNTDFYLTMNLLTDAGYVIIDRQPVPGTIMGRLNKVDFKKIGEYIVPKRLKVITLIDLGRKGSETMHEIQQLIREGRRDEAIARYAFISGDVGKVDSTEIVDNLLEKFYTHKEIRIIKKGNAND
jgi:hypothetical protein